MEEWRVTNLDVFRRSKGRIPRQVAISLGNLMCEFLYTIHLELGMPGPPVT